MDQEITNPNLKFIWPDQAVPTEPSSTIASAIQTTVTNIVENLKKSAIDYGTTKNYKNDTEGNSNIREASRGILHSMKANITTHSLTATITSHTEEETLRQQSVTEITTKVINSTISSTTEEISSSNKQQILGNSLINIYIGTASALIVFVAVLLCMAGWRLYKRRRLIQATNEYVLNHSPPPPLELRELGLDPIERDLDS